jgi:hypothetical protein
VNEPDLFSSKPCFWIKRDLLRLGYALAHDHALIVGEIGQRGETFRGSFVRHQADRRDITSGGDVQS